VQPSEVVVVEGVHAAARVGHSAPRSDNIAAGNTTAAARANTDRWATPRRRPPVRLKELRKLSGIECMFEA
jgi:hypothetical protein